MTKEARKQKVSAQQAKAVLRNIRISPQKLNLLAQAIRGQHVSDALDILAFSRKRAARDVHKLLMSAISNAENNHGLDIDGLFVSEASVGKAMVMRRFHARARGRGVRIMKPFSHFNLILSEMKGSQ